MPELPEVETTVRDLRFIVGLSIINIKLHRNNIRYPIPKKKIKLTKNSKILSIIRIGKYIVLNLSIKYSIIIHTIDVNRDERNRKLKIMTINIYNFKH